MRILLRSNKEKKSVALFVQKTSDYAYSVRRKKKFLLSEGLKLKGSEVPIVSNKYALEDENGGKIFFFNLDGAQLLIGSTDISKMQFKIMRELAFSGTVSDLVHSAEKKRDWFELLVFAGAIGVACLFIGFLIGGGGF